MKKLLLLFTLMSSLTFSKDIEECNGFTDEINQIPKEILNFSTSLNKLKSNITIENVDNLSKVNNELEGIVDHLMYYHYDELDVVQLSSMRKYKVTTQESDKIIQDLRKEIEKDER